MKPVNPANLVHSADPAVPDSSGQGDDALPDAADANGDLAAALADCYHIEPPDDFLECLMQRFDASIQNRFRIMWGAIIGAAFAILTPLIWLIIFQFTVFTKIFAAAAHLFIWVVSSVMSLWTSAPQTGTGILIILWTLLFIVAISLIKTFQGASLMQGEEA